MAEGDVTTYVAQSSVGWLDLDEVASQRAAELIRAFDEPSTLDPIGLGAIRDGLADQLVPGTSTVQTELRYFSFVTWICRRLEQQRVAPADFPAALRRTEVRLMDRLAHMGPGQGVIGFHSRNTLKRLPSEVYWGGLGSWGVRRDDLSIAEYGRQLGRDSGLRIRDDDGETVGRHRSPWAGYVPAPSGFLDDEIDFTLTAEEAGALVGLISARHPRSLLAFSLADAAAAADTDWPWEVERLPDPLAEVVHHAEMASLVTAGPQLLYNLLIAERASADLQWDTTPLSQRLRDDLETWNAEVAGDARVAAWTADLAPFWAVVGVNRAIAPPLRRFVEEIVNEVGTGQFADNQMARELVTTREADLKRGRARIRGPLSVLEGWNQQPFGSRLNYRWPTGTRYLSRFAEALEGGG